MDAIGAYAPEPDDSYLFSSIVANLAMDEDKVEQSAAEPEPAPTTGSAAEPVEPAAVTPAPTPPVKPATEPEPAHAEPAADRLTETSPGPVRAPAPAPAPNRDQMRALVPPPTSQPRHRPVAETPPPSSQPPKRTIRTAMVDWIDRRSRSGPASSSEDSEITTGAFVAVCLITVVVAVLAFILSFDMMVVAARHYGWDANLARLFPIIIDVGAVGGTFMGAISANHVYRRIGHQVLVVTLAASVLYNLVGHDIKGNDPVLAGLPKEWSWTGTVAAVLIPMLLAYFVHAFSKALKAFTDQRRAKKAAEQEEQDPQAQTMEMRTTEAPQPPLPALPLPVPPPAQPTPATPAPPTRPAQPAPAPRPTPPAKSTSKTGARPPTKTTGKPELGEQTAMDWVRKGAPGAPKGKKIDAGMVREHFIAEGFTVPTDRTVRRWLSRGRNHTP